MAWPALSMPAMMGERPQKEWHCSDVGIMPRSIGVSPAVAWRPALAAGAGDSRHRNRERVLEQTNTFHAKTQSRKVAEGAKKPEMLLFASLCASASWRENVHSLAASRRAGPRWIRAGCPLYKRIIGASAQDRLSWFYLGTTDLGKHFIFQYIPRFERRKAALWTLCFL